MATPSRICVLSRFILTAIALCTFTQASLAQGVLERDAPSASMPPDSFAFEMRGKPWGTVFEWLADKTGLPFISADVPTGSFNFIAKKGQKFTIPQIVDIINDGLLLQNYILIKRQSSFTVVPADREIIPSLVRHVAPGQLAEHGKTEIVSTIIKLKVLAAKDVAGEVKKQMGAFGKVTPLTTMNQLLLQDTVSSLERVIAAIEEIDQVRTKPRVLEVVPLLALDARRVTETLRAIFPESKALAPYIEGDSGRNAVIIKGTAEEVAEVKAAIQSMGEDLGSRNLLVFTLDKGSGVILADALHRIINQMRPQSPVRVIGVSKE